MSVPQMNSMQEMLEYFNGRTVAAMHVVALLVASRDLPTKAILTATQEFIKKVESECDETPDGKAYVAGYASVLPLMREALKSASDVKILLSGNGHKTH